MGLSWTIAAAGDLRRIRERIRRDNPAAAKLVGARIRNAAKRLIALEQPLMGREGLLPGTREWFVRKTSYLLTYRVLGDEVTILRVIYAGRERPLEDE